LKPTGRSERMEYPGNALFVQALDDEA
jgi:hypothetical protein